MYFLLKKGHILIMIVYIHVGLLALFTAFVVLHLLMHYNNQLQ